MERHDLARDVQAEPDAGQAGLTAVERLEDLLALGRGHARAVIAHGDPHLVVRARDLDFDGRRRGAVFHGVVEQVRHDLLEAKLIDVRPRRAAVAGRADLDLAPGYLGEGGGGSADQLRDVGRRALELEPARADARHVEEPFEQIPQPHRGVLRLRHVPPRRRRVVVGPREAPRHELQPAVEDRERGAQLVGHDGDEVLAQTERLLNGSLVLADVARDGRRADDRAARVADRRDRHRDRDPLAILRHARGPVVLDAFAAAEPVQDLRQLVGALRGDDDGDRPTDRLVRRVAVEPLGPRVPAHDRPVERLADDRVVRRVDDRGEIFGRPPRRRVGRRQLVDGHRAWPLQAARQPSSQNLCRPSYIRAVGTPTLRAWPGPRP